MKILLIYIISMIFLSGCTLHRYEKAPMILPATYGVSSNFSPIVVSIKIIEGETTRQEVLDQLGTPDSFNENSYTYFFNHTDKVCKLELTTKKKEQFNIELGDDIDWNYKYSHLSIWFRNCPKSNKDTDIIDSVSFN